MLSPSVFDSLHLASPSRPDGSAPTLATNSSHAGATGATAPVGNVLKPKATNTAGSSTLVRPPPAKLLKLNVEMEPARASIHSCASSVDIDDAEVCENVEARCGEKRDSRGTGCSRSGSSAFTPRSTGGACGAPSSASLAPAFGFPPPSPERVSSGTASPSTVGGSSSSSGATTSAPGQDDASAGPGGSHLRRESLEGACFTAPSLASLGHDSLDSDDEYPYVDDNSGSTSLLTPIDEVDGGAFVAALPPQLSNPQARQPDGVVDCSTFGLSRISTDDDSFVIPGVRDVRRGLYRTQSVPVEHESRLLHKGAAAWLSPDSDFMSPSSSFGKQCSVLLPSVENGTVHKCVTSRTVRALIHAAAFS